VPRRNCNAAARPSLAAVPNLAKLMVSMGLVPRGERPRPERVVPSGWRGAAPIPLTPPQQVARRGLGWERVALDG
jgi:hypothetical protein